MFKDLDTHNYSFKNPHSMEKIQLLQTNLKIKSYIPLCRPDEDISDFYFICENNLFLIWVNHESEFLDYDIEVEDENDEIGVAIRHGRQIYGLTHHGMKLIMMKD